MQEQPRMAGADAMGLAAYFSKVSAALSRLDEELERWNNYKADYKALKSTLLDMPQKTTHSVMVPVGNLAFMPGKLVHTNEILVMLGDNWFVDRSAVQAAEIVDRRMDLVEENLTKLTAQQEELRSKSGIAPGLLGGQEYNEEGLPIVEITEPYFSDDENEDDKKQSAPAILPFSQKTPEEQAADRAILDRIADLEREDEERERRREAGEVVTSDEDTDSDDDIDINYDDEEDDASEDEFRPKGLDTDEEYEEEVWEPSGDESDMDVDETIQSHPENASSSSKKSVRFADQLTKATKAGSSKRSGSGTKTPSTSSKPKSPADLLNQMRARQRSMNTAESGPIVTMDTLESTLSQLSTGDSSPMDATGDLDTAMSEQTKESTPLKSALKSSPKKVSIFKHNRVMANEFAQEEKAEAVAPTVTPVVKDEEPSLPPKKMSKFAMQRAAANPNKSEQPQSSGSVSTKPAKGGLSDLVVERGVVPTLKQETTTIAHKAVVAETPAPAPTPVASLKDIIENTFTKKSTEVPEPAAPAARSAKSSLFRLRQQQQQKQQQRSYFEPEPAVPDSSFVDPDDDDSYVSSGLIIPAVQSHSSKGKTQASTIVERAPKEKSVTPKGPTLRAIPVVESSKLRDTSLMKGAIVEREDIDSVDEDELEDDMLMRQVVSEYQERRQAMIAKHGMFNREGIDKMWEEQVIIPPGMVIPEPQALTEGVQIIKEDEDQEMEDVDQDEEEQEEQAMEVDDRNERPKKLSLFRAARLTGSLAKQ